MLLSEIPSGASTSYTSVSIGSSRCATLRRARGRTWSPVNLAAAGAEHTCALLVDRTVQCWGGNSRGQLGDGSMKNRLVPTLITQAVADAVLDNPENGMPAGFWIS